MSIRLLISLISLFSLGQAWGPVSHYFFAREALVSGAAYNDSSVKQGCDMPDGFYFSNFGEFPACTVPVSAMHNPLTAGYFVKFALNQTPTDTFDPLSFALGYGSHMIADLVGFHSEGGFLGDTVQSYVTTFPFMTSADALCYTLDTFPSTPWVTEEATAFVAAAGDWYRAQNPQFALFNQTDVDTCAFAWQTTQEQLVQIAALQAKTGYYKDLLLALDRYNSTTFDQVNARFTASNKCAVKAINTWTQYVLDNATTPEQALARIVADVGAWFGTSECTGQQQL